MNWRLIMWLLTWKFPSQGECEFVAFDSEIVALEQAAGEVLAHVESEWDMSVPLQYGEAKSINESMLAGNWAQVVNLFNGSSTNADHNFMIWEVVKLTPKTVAWTVPQPLSLPKEEKEEAPPTLKPENISYQASEPGATCRGPKCGVYSEYAYADNTNGTFLCHSCKMMISIFGS